MLSKEINLTYDMCYTAWVEILRNPLSSAKEMDILESLIKKHFELVEKHEMLENTYSMFCEDYLNPQPYKFEDLKADMYLYDAKKNEIIYLFKPLDWEPTKGLRYSYEKIDHSAYGFYMDFEDNRFYPVYIVK